MTKKRTNITLDPQIYERAKSEGINVSRLTEKTLKRYIRRLEGKGSEDEGLFREILGTENTGGPGVSDQTAEEFLDDFCQSCLVDWNLAESTTKERMRYAKKLVDFVDGHPLEADKSQLRQFIQQFKDDNAIKTVRVIYGRYFDRVIAQSFQVPRRNPSPKKVPNKQGLRKMYKELQTTELRAALLVLASSGLRRGELLDLDRSQLELDQRAIYPPEKGETRKTKRQWVTFYNHEAERVLEELGVEEKRPNESIFEINPRTLTRKLAEASKQAGTIRTTPQTLRVWFADQMNRLGVADRYIDAFCGRTPKSVLAKHYTDFSPRRLQEVYEEAGIEVLG